MDKSGWPDGPWKDEPDKVQWQDEATGLPCMIRRNPRFGNWCGYVGVAKDHPLHGKGDDDADLSVHGGVTFADGCHGDPERDICHVPDPGEPDDVWWFGFDCAHSHDITPGNPILYEATKQHNEMTPDWCTYKDVAYVHQQCAFLASQLHAVAIPALVTQSSHR